jgi:hypothetical protein
MPNSVTVPSEDANATQPSVFGERHGVRDDLRRSFLHTIHK